MRQRQNEQNTIIRTNKRENPYVMIDKFGLSDERLSWKAKGLLAYLLSKPDDWQIYESELIKRSTDGRDAVRTGLRELEKYGYMSRRQIRREDGSFSNMEYIVYERPIEMPDEPVDGRSVDGKQPLTDFPSTENPLTENPPLLNNDLTKNDLTMYACMGAAEEIAATAESPLPDLIYLALQEEAAGMYIDNGVSMVKEPHHLIEIYSMLHKQFPNQLEPEIIKIACTLFVERTLDMTEPVPGGWRLKMDLRNPTGYFQHCYKDAIIEYKARQSVLKKRKRG